MLKFLVGRACTGKTHRIIETVAETSKNKKAILIVPEQFSFESERAILKYSDACADNISVLSFSRIFDFVSEAYGRGTAACVSDFEKMILLKKALTASSEQLCVFSRFVKYRDFVKSVSDTIRDLKFAAVEPDDLLRAALEIGGTCGAKLKDISCIMSAYDALLSEKYIDPADKLTKLYGILRDYEYFKNTDVFFDSFTGFTGQQYKVIKKIIEQADNVTFSFSANDPEDESYGVFYNTCSAIGKLKTIARSCGVDDIETERLTASYYSNPSMEDLESLMFSTAENCVSNGNVNVISCESNRMEALAACNIISREIKNNGYRFKDFIVVARNAESYVDDMLRQCDKHGISCYCDRKFALAFTPLCTYVLCLIEAAASMTAENVLALLKTDLSDFSEEEVFNLENYLYIWDIEPDDWQISWEMSVRGLTTEEERESEILRLAAINDTRQKVFELLKGFSENFIGTPEKRCEAIFDHLISNKIDKKLAEYCVALTGDNELYLASVIKQSWDSFITVLNSMVRVMDKVPVSGAEFVESLQIALDAASISSIPQMLDEVTFGSADRIRPSKPKISVILGANQGVFPQIGSSKGLLAAGDKEKLKKFDIVFDDDAVKGAIEENYLVYSMLCCPVDKVYILYSKKDSSGAELSPSSFVGKITGAFKDVEVKNFSLSVNGDFVPQTEESAYSEIGILHIDDYSSVKESIKDYKNYYERLGLIESASESYDFTIMPETADKLFGKNINISATSFDTYHRCRLSYLLKCGFYAKKLEKADLGVLQRGRITHYVLEKIVEKYHSSLGSLTPAEISAAVDTLIAEYFSFVKGSEKLMTARFSYLLEKIAVSVKNIVTHMATEFAQSDFKASFCELNVGDKGDIPGLKYTLDDGTVINFEGQIDRVDVYENYVRVVDYKTGTLTFRLSDTLEGLNMQMLLYLYAFVRNGSELVNDPVPAGILYMPAKDSDKPSGLRMNGVILDKPEIRIAMEKDDKGRYIPKSGDSSSYLESGGFELVFEQIDKLIVNMGNTLRKGEFYADPTDGATFDACKYCDYSGICRSRSLPHKKAELYTNDETLNILKGDE